MRRGKRMLPSFLLALCIAGCSGDSAPAPAPATDLAAVRERIRKEGARIEEIAHRPWLASLVPVKQALVTWHSQAVGWLDLARDGAEARPLLPRAQELLARFDGGLGGMLERLESVAPFADRVFAVERTVTALLEGMSIPDDQPFPLRTRFVEGWVEQKHEHFRLVALGLQDALSKGNDERFRIGAKNLERVAEDGERLLEEVDTLARRIELVDRKLGILADRIAWADRVLEKAETEGVTAELAPIRRIRDTASARLPELEAQWMELRPRCARRPEEEQEAVEALAATLEQLQTDLARPTLPLAVKLGITARGQ